MTAKKGPSALKRLKEFKKNVVAQFQNANNHKNKKRRVGHAPATTLSSISAKQQSTVRNLFELQIGKAKHQVLNRHVQGSVGRPTAVAKKGAEKRRDTLAQELKQRKRETAFVDKRFGEYNKTMPEGDKMMARMINQKRTETKSLFNLEEETLTHMGHSLDDIEDFNGRNRGFEGVDDSDDEGQLNRKFVANFHFGGFDKEKDARMSKSDVMKELVAKSKHYKAQRQKQHEEDLDIIEEVDAEIDDIRSLLAPHTNQQIQQKRQASGDDYDQVIKSLVFESRAAPTDRIKSAEEIQLAHERKMRELEADRLRRMRPEGSLSSRPETQADDLGDDYMIERDNEDFGLDDSDADDQEKEKIRSMEAMPLTYVDGKLINTEIFMKKKRKRDGEDEGEIEENGRAGSSDDEEDGSDGDEDGSDEGDSENDESEVVEVKSRNEAIAEEDEDDDGEEEDEDDDINADGISDQEHEQNIEPVIKTLLATATKQSGSDEAIAPLPSSGADALETDPKKLEEQLNYLRDSIKNKPVKLRESLYISILDSLEQTPLSFNAFEVLAKHIIQLARSSASVAAEDALKRLKRIEDGLKSYLASGRTSPGWPATQDLLLLRLFGLIFPTSDFDHPVATPTVLLLCRFLSLVRIEELSDAVSGLFICNLFYEFQMVAKRYIPEVVTFLVGLLQAASCHADLASKSLFGVSASDVKSGLFAKVNWSAKEELLDLSDTRGVSDGRAVSILSTTLNLMMAYSQLWIANQEIFEAVHTFLISIKDDMPFAKSASQRALLDEVSVKIGDNVEKMNAARVPLRFKGRKPVAIPTFMPKFDEGYSMDRRYTNTQRAAMEKKKLQYQHRKEFRGAVRELKRDAAFIANETLKAKKEASEAYNAKIKRIMGTLATQEGEMKKFEKGGRKRR